MKMKYTLMALAAMTGAASAATVFSDTFDYSSASGADLVANHGWTSYTGTNANLGTGSAGGVTYLYGNGNTLSYNHTVDLTEGAVLNINANIDPARATSGYTYGKTISLWDGVNAGTIASKATITQAGNLFTTDLNYTVTAADITAGLDQVIFTYSVVGWGQLADITFDVEAVPEPSSAALLGLVGFSLILRRRR